MAPNPPTIPTLIARMTGRTDLESAADSLLVEFSGSIAGSPAAYTQMLIALDFALGPGREYVIAGRRGDEEVEDMIRAAAGRFEPGSVILFRPEEGGEILKAAPMLEGMTSVGGKATAYICEGFRCSAPAVGAEEFRKRLSEMERNLMGDLHAS